MGNAIESSSPDTFFVVSIGASAGGLRALEEYFENMPSDSGAAFVVVQHLSPDYKSLMSELLKHRTNMDVQQVTEQVSLTPNTVFLIPPGQNMVLENDHFHLMPQDRGQGRQPNFPIDRFFQSLSTEVREHTISIILSGTGSDGSRGIQEIAEMGGIVLAQDPATAEFDGMPQSAIATGVVDLVLAPNELAQATHQFVTSPHDLQAFRDDQQNRLAPLQLQRIVNIVEQYENIDFTHYKPSTVTRRIERRCLIAGYRDLDSYIHRLETSEEERGALRNDLLITVTRFFRDGEAWRLLEESILPELIQRLGPKQTLRIWITACATGEEAYSMAILLRELLDKRTSSIDAKIFATDIDQVALSKASSGVYPASIVNELGEERLNRFFTPKDDSSFEVSRSLREMIIFASHNLAKDAGFTHMDLVTCRNVLIYMQPELQDQVLRNLHFALKAKGVLFLGESETLGKIEDEFIPLHRKWKIYQKVRDVKLPLATQSVAALNLKQLRSYPAVAAPPPRFDPLLEAAFKTLLTQEKTTCLLSDRQNQLLYVCGDALNLLTVPSGRSSRDLIQMLPQSLQLPLSTALHRVRQGRENSVRYSGCQITDANRDDLTVTLEISQQAANRKTSEFYLVAITQERLAKIAQLPTQFEADTDTAQYVLQLEEELHRTRENLQATIEELETTNEEQQATNEELIASNEELQSTNEELQSVNEELYTVNAEYQSKIQELIQLNNDLDNLLGNIEVGVIFLDNELRIRKFTPAATVACNLVDADLHRPIGHLSHNLENFDLLDCLEQANQQRHTVEREVQVKRQGPYLLMRVYPYLNENKTVDGLILTFVNIDEIKRAQLRLAAAEIRLSQANESLEEDVKNRTAELEASQHFLESINQATPNNVYIYDLIEKCNVYCNRPLEETLGYTPEELQAMEAGIHTSLFHPEDLDKVAAYHQSIAESTVTDSSGDIFKIEYRVRHADGAWHWLYSQDIIYQRNADGHPTQLLGTAVDISDRKQAEANLQESETRYRSLYQNTPAMLHSINSVGELLDVSDRWLQTFGYERSEVIGRKSLEFLTPESRQHAQAILSDYYQTGVCTDVPYQWVCKDGSIRDVLLSATAAQDDSGNFLRSLAVLVDVTEHKKARTELTRYREHLEDLVKERAAQLQAANRYLQAEVLERQQAEQELAKRAQALEQSNADLEQFAYVISHDLQEPLRAMTVFSQLLAGEYGQHLDAAANDYIQHIVDGGVRMHGLINGILAFSRATHAESTFETMELELGLMIAIENLSSAINDAQAIVTYDALPTLSIDQNQIIQLFQNLIGNAIKFRSAERPCIHISAQRQSASWCFGVQDNGIGIAKEQQERTFALFQRLHTRQELDGYGIGLAICKKIVERHHGHIWVDSDPGNGTTFYFTLAGVPDPSLPAPDRSNSDD
ncbi:PAS domain S-box protein [Leptolyngbya cf. ectocarpi LEGE 11479]|uniref:histidine kinase n=1 Tax=Leptolyngbya cf. ectocarpi LEGE 11479 TaxID=1828722 RepID=A0A928ZVQ6_LEPEC|nr:CheR family methyltransferase [Leptolyngbya ectocarpi]MBE9068359.1 PAS domain S-box protein [Leptolyngbya cf. ectocarpi LEGE 11479]